MARAKNPEAAREYRKTLRLAITGMDFKKATLAKHLGVDVSTLTRQLSGDVLPSKSQRDLLQLLMLVLRPEDLDIDRQEAERLMRLAITRHASHELRAMYWRDYNPEDFKDSAPWLKRLRKRVDEAVAGNALELWQMVWALGNELLDLIGEEVIKAKLFDHAYTFMWTGTAGQMIGQTHKALSRYDRGLGLFPAGEEKLEINLSKIRRKLQANRVPVLIRLGRLRLASAAITELLAQAELAENLRAITYYNHAWLMLVDEDDEGAKKALSALIEVFRETVRKDERSLRLALHVGVDPDLEEFRTKPELREFFEEIAQIAEQEQQRKAARVNDRHMESGR